MVQSSGSAQRSVEDAHPEPLSLDELLEDFALGIEFDGPDLPPKGQHTRLLNEPRDERWAAPVEQQIEQAIAAFRLDVNERIEVPFVECKSSLCELRAVGSVDDQRTPGDWFGALHALSSSDWGAGEFSDVQTAMRPLPDGRVAYITFLVRHSDPNGG